MKYKPINSIELENRIEIICEMLLKGFSAKDIKKQADEMLWNISSRQIEHYIRTAKNKIASKKNSDELQYELNLSLNRLELLFRNTFELQDYKTALSVIEKKCKLLGLPENNISSDNKLEITHNILLNGSKVNNIEYDNDIIDFKYDV